MSDFHWWIPVVKVTYQRYDRVLCRLCRVCRMLQLAASAPMARPLPSFVGFLVKSGSEWGSQTWTYECKRLENWINHKMDAPSAAIAKVVVVHVLQTRLCIYVCTLQAFCIIWNSGWEQKDKLHSIHDFVNFGETCCEEAATLLEPREA